MALNASIANLTSINSVYTFAKFAADATNGLFYGVVIVAFFFVLLFRLLDQGVDKAIASASFSCALVSWMFMSIGLLQIVYPIIFSVMLAGTLFYMKMQEN